MTVECVAANCCAGWMLRRCREGLTSRRDTLRRLCAVLILLVCAVSGCVHEPVRLDVDGNLTANLLPTPHQEPLVPMLLPHQKHDLRACRVAVVDVDGLLLNADATGLGSWGENPVALFRERLDAIERDRRVRAVVVRIHSPGGSVTATDIMWRDLLAFKRRTGLPVVACLMDVAAGGAYYLATGADQIVAQPTTITGAIGCVLNVYNLQDLMAQFNILGGPVKAGQNIDLGSPVKALDEPQKQLLQDMANEFHRRFRDIVRQQRPAVDAANESTFDGRVFTASTALDLNLIDGIGSFDQAVQLARDLGGVQKAELVFYHRPGDRALSPYSITPNIPWQNSLIPVSVPGLDRSRLPSFLYLWQCDPALETLGGR